MNFLSDNTMLQIQRVMSGDRELVLLKNFSLLVLGDTPDFDSIHICIPTCCLAISEYVPNPTKICILSLLLDLEYPDLSGSPLVTQWKLVNISWKFITVDNMSIPTQYGLT